MCPAHTQIKSCHLPRLDLASSNNPQRLSSHHHHRQQRPGAPHHHHHQWLPPATTVAVTTHHHHWPPTMTTANTNHKEATPCHHPQQLSVCLVMECVGENMARCHVVQHHHLLQCEVSYPMPPPHLSFTWNAGATSTSVTH